MGLKAPGDRSDEWSMDYPSTGVLIVNGLIAAAAILGVLSVWASRVGHVCDLHDLKVECDTLRHHYAEHSGRCAPTTTTRNRSMPRWSGG